MTEWATGHHEMHRTLLGPSSPQPPVSHHGGEGLGTVDQQWQAALRDGPEHSGAVSQVSASFKKQLLGRGDLHSIQWQAS